MVLSCWVAEQRLSEGRVQPGKNERKRKEDERWTNEEEASAVTEVRLLNSRFGRHWQGRVGEG